MGLSGEWVLLFEDEFDAPVLDTSQWVTCYWWDDDGCTISSNNELQWYQPSNVFTQGGILRLQAKEEPILTPSGVSYDYTSGIVTTGKDTSDRNIPHNFIFQYGYAEIRANIPSGQGLWPAFWLLPADHISRPEIDVLEILGHDPFTNHLHFHFLNQFSERMSAGSKWISSTDLSEDWHTFGIDWQPESLTWYVDGEEIWRFENEEVIPDEPMYLLLNLAVGGDWPGTPDETTSFPAEFNIDYVQIWRRGSEATTVPLVKDTFITSEDEDGNFGEASLLSIDGLPQKITLLQFDNLSVNYSGIESATLRLHTGPDEGDASLQTAVIHHVPQYDWQEESLTYRNSSFQLGDAIGAITAPLNDTTYEVALDTAVFNANPHQPITLAIISERDDGLHLISKENSTHIPRLTLTPLDHTQHLPLMIHP
jgi:beta-glucanase (GH16 family)